MAADRPYYPSTLEEDDEEKSIPSSSEGKKTPTSFFRSTWPSDFTFKIERFSSVKGGKTEVHLQSHSFEAVGYHWRIQIRYSDVHDYLSLYLLLEDRDNLYVGEDVCVDYKLFLYDQLRGRFLTLHQDGDGSVTRYNKLKTQHGFPQFISYGAFADASNGYLLDDVCVFGAEIFLINTRPRGEVLSYIHTDHNFVWRINNFSEIKEDVYYSKELHAAGRKWKVGLVPKGEMYNQRSHLCIRLHLVDEHETVTLVSTSRIIRWFQRYFCKKQNQQPSSTRRINMGCLIRTMDQLEDGYYENFVCHWFGAEKCSSLCFIMPMSALNDPVAGFLVDDTLIMEVKLCCASELKNING